MPVPEIGAVPALAAKGAGLMGGISVLGNDSNEDEEEDISYIDEDNDVIEEAETARGNCILTWLIPYG